MFLKLVVFYLKIQIFFITNINSKFVFVRSSIRFLIQTILQKCTLLQRVSQFYVFLPFKELIKQKLNFYY